MGLILELTRNIGRESARMHAGEPWQTHLGIEIEGRTLGVIGLGKLGTKVSKLAQAFGMNVIAWSPNLTPEKCKEAGVTYASKEELFKTADVITIHVVLGPRSRGLVGREDLLRMKPTAYIVNTARGPIIDEQALLEVLQQKKIAGAGIDVFSVEPLPVDHPFRRLDNMVITPHLGYATEEIFRGHYTQMVEGVDAWFKGETPRQAGVASRRRPSREIVPDDLGKSRTPGRIRRAPAKFALGLVVRAGAHLRHHGNHVLAGDQPADPGRHMQRRLGPEHGGKRGQPFLHLRAGSSSAML